MGVPARCAVERNALPPAAAAARDANMLLTLRELSRVCALSHKLPNLLHFCCASPALLALALFSLPPPLRRAAAIPSPYLHDGISSSYNMTRETPCIHHNRPTTTTPDRSRRSGGGRAVGSSAAAAPRRARHRTSKKGWVALLRHISSQPSSMRCVLTVLISYLPAHPLLVA